MEISARKTCLTIPLVLLIFTFLEASCFALNASRLCRPSSCGHVHNITHPFRLSSDPENCGDSRYELVCENNNTVVYLRNFPTYLHPEYFGERWSYIIRKRFNQTKIIPSKYYVQAINYHNYTIRVVAPNVRDDNCSSIPIFSLSKRVIEKFETFTTEVHYSSSSGETTRVKELTRVVTFLSCGNSVPQPKRHHPYYIEADSCVRSNSNNTRSYVVVDHNLRYSNVEESCHIEAVTLITARNATISSYRDVHREVAYGFELSWLKSFCDGNSTECDRCYVDEDQNEAHCPKSEIQYDPFVKTCGLCDVLFHTDFLHNIGVLCGILSAPRILCMILVLSLLAYKWHLRHRSVYDGIEEFLQSNSNLMPIRYSYWEIIKMTNLFKDKLGEGGFGSVYKGKLSSGQLVAIKMLGKAKANCGQDFINEVATIGRIHHINVVQLIGFCVKGSTRALVYNFMPNGSLDKYLFQREGVDCPPLSYRNIFDVSLGVARGIEYLHRGCNMQILHFDIKPHNILLDENFVPKVSDFGLARLCPLNNSVVSLTTVRGTIGYIAPEFFYKNIGRVSHKSDVYSFGMLLMEMANKRKNVNAKAENTSQVYFPLWVYDQFSKGESIKLLEDAVEEEEEDWIKKMIIVALWCIQLKPSDRPSMTKVIEMLEGGTSALEIPPKLCLYPQEGEQKEEQESLTSSESTAESGEISLMSDAY